MADVVCITFLLAWMPYAAVSLISALIPRDDQEAEGTLNAVVEETTGVALNSPKATKILDIPSLLSWTAVEHYRHIYYNPENKWNEVNNMSEAMFSANLDNGSEPMTTTQPFSSLPPVVTLIPALFAKSHCMINPFIYQIMNREFRNDVYVMVFGLEMTDRRRVKGRTQRLYEGKEYE